MSTQLQNDISIDNENKFNNLLIDDITSETIDLEVVEVTEVEKIQDPLHSAWSLWSHECNERNWRIESFSVIVKFNTIENFWKTYNNFGSIGGLGCRDYFLMREGILPIWEDPSNKNGKVWSVQIPISYINNVWTELSMALIGEYLIDEMGVINGLSIASKDNCFIIKIWVKTTGAVFRAD